MCGRPCVLVGFALAGCAVAYFKKKGKDVFMKLLLQGVQFMSFERYGFLLCHCSSAPYVQKTKQK